MGGAATFEVLRGTELTWSLVQMKLSDLHYFDSWFGSAAVHDRNCPTSTWPAWNEVSSSSLARAGTCRQACGACSS